MVRASTLNGQPVDEGQSVVQGLEILDHEVADGDRGIELLQRADSANFQGTLIEIRQLSH
jgi:hypothetical protein